MLRKSFQMNLLGNEYQNYGNCSATERTAASLLTSPAKSLYRLNIAASCDGALNVMG